jgi:hypothetical protein
MNGVSSRMWPLAGMLLASTGCLDDLQDPPPSSMVATVTAVPGGGHLTCAPGADVTLGLQATASDGRGVNGVDFFFALPDTTEASFKGFAGLSTRRVQSANASIGAVSAEGIAAIAVAVATTTKSSTVEVFGGLAERPDSLDATDPALAVQTFVIEVLALEEANGGAPGTGGGGSAGRGPGGGGGAGGQGDEGAR